MLAALDVAGAPAQAIKLAKKDDHVLILGANGKSGILCAYQAKKVVGPKGKVIGLVRKEEQKQFLETLNIFDEIIIGDALNAIDTYHKVSEITDGNLCDLTINVVNIQNTEMASILSTKDNGTVYFFSMATSFTKAALGAEGIGKDVNMIIGNGYTKDHAEITLNLMRESRVLHDLFLERYQ